MDDATVKKVKPHNIEAEQSIIYCMLQSTDAIVTAMQEITEDDFYSSRFGIVFRAIVGLYEENLKKIDLVSLQNRLRELKAPDEVTDLSFIKNLFQYDPKVSNVSDYIGIVRDKSTRRKIIAINETLANDCYGIDASTSDIIQDAEKKLLEIVSGQTSEEITPIREVVNSSINKIALASKNEGNVTGLPTGFKELDYMLAGLQPSDLILIAARPSMGKTAFVLNLAQYVCFHEKQSAIVFSLEMSKEQLVNRLLSLESHVEAINIRSGNLSDKDWEGLIEASSVIGESDILIDDTAGISINELASKCRKYKLRKDIKLIIIDYLQLMNGGNKRIESRQQEISEISRSLKSLARELNVPVIALSQLSRAVEKRDDKRPMLSDLRESGAIEQDADVVMFLYRDEYYNKESEKRGIAEVIVAKQRNGPIGTRELAWIPKYTKFANIDKSKVPT